MSLPKINHPTFTVDIPSTGKKLRLRPFLVREEKILLLAQTSDDPADVSDAIKQVINNCAMDDINIDSFTTFDLEYVFLKLRAKSVGNIIDMKYTDPIDNNVYDVQINLDDVKLLRDPNHTNKITITKDTGIILRYPKAEMADTLKNAQSELDLLFAVIKYCIESVYDSEQVYQMSDYSDEDIDSFINDMSVETFQKIQKFFETLPRLHYEVKYNLIDSGEERVIVLKNLTDFFTLR